VIQWGESAYAEERYICTQILFAQLFPGASKSLTSMCDRLVLDSSERDDRHGALLDADTTADALILLERPSRTVRAVRRDHGPPPDRRDGNVNKRHSPMRPRSSQREVNAEKRQLDRIFEEKIFVRHGSCCDSEIEEDEQIGEP
jgi:DNA polymerase III epsilon subunit-like protein